MWDPFDITEEDLKIEDNKKAIEYLERKYIPQMIKALKENPCVEGLNEVHSLYMEFLYDDDAPFFTNCPVGCMMHTLLNWLFDVAKTCSEDELQMRVKQLIVLCFFGTGFFNYSILMPLIKKYVFYFFEDDEKTFYQNVVTFWKVLYDVCFSKESKQNRIIQDSRYPMYLEIMRINFSEYDYEHDTDDLDEIFQKIKYKCRRF